MKKILILSNTTPSVENPTGGIYINKRLSEYKEMGIDFDVFGFFYEESTLLKGIKNLLGKVIYDNYREKIIVEDIEFFGCFFKKI
jgi:hypothetical protein